MNRREMLKAALFSPLALIPLPKSQGCQGDCNWCERFPEGDPIVAGEAPARGLLTVPPGVTSVRVAQRITPVAHLCTAECRLWEYTRGGVKTFGCGTLTPPPPGATLLGGRS